jgi:hypothetical protein
MGGTPPEILVLRAWLEPGEPSLRVRIVAVRPGLPDQRVAATASVDEACEAVRDWLINIENMKNQKLR